MRRPSAGITAPRLPNRIVITGPVHQRIKIAQIARNFGASCHDFSTPDPRNAPNPAHSRDFVYELCDPVRRRTVICGSRFRPVATQVMVQIARPLYRGVVTFEVSPEEAWLA